MRRWGIGLVAGLLVCCALSAGAHADAQPLPFLLFADAKETGFIKVYLLGPPGSKVRVAELEGAHTVPLATAVLDSNGLAVIRRAGRWRCDRRTRTLVATRSLPDGSVAATGHYAVRTPSCRRRLTLRAPQRAHPGRTVRIGIGDRWRLGGLRAHLCTAGAGAQRRCRALVVPRAGRRVRVRTAGRGRLRLLLRTRWERARRTVYVGVRPPRPPRARRGPRILVTGDSLMQIVASYVDDRLGRRARVSTDIHGGTGPSKLGFDWIAHARRQAARLRPRATLVLLGANDGVSMTTPGGLRVECCGEPWVAEYARRVGLMMRAWTRRGAGRVVWLTLPAPRTKALVPIFSAVDAALRRAVAGAPGVEVLALDDILSPGFQYRDRVEIGGRSVKVHESDGVHLSAAGGSYVASLAIAALRAHGIP